MLDRLGEGRLAGERPAGDEEGAVAIVVALLLSVLLIISAFAVDFGLSYTSSLSLQTAADAASTAAASSYADEQVTCVGGTLARTGGARSLGVMQSDAQTTAADIMAANHLDAVESPGAFTVGCESGAIVVRWANTATTDVGLGGVIGMDEITTERRSAAALSVPDTTVDGLRPYAVCSDDLPASLPSGIMTIRYPGHVATGSQCPSTSGGWLTLNCPVVADGNNYPDEGNGQPALEYATEFGCSNPVSIVPNQDTDPAVRHNQMVAACNPPANTPDGDCLGVQTGDVGNRRIWDAWRAILGEEITHPVICGQPPCTPAVSIGSGNNARHPVQRLAGVTVCGFHFGSNAQRHGDTQDGPCAGADASPGGNRSVDNYLLLVFNSLQTAGTVTPSTCTIGDTSCDGGLRRVLLTE